MTGPGDEAHPESRVSADAKFLHVDLAAAQARCQATRWPEHHIDDCLWCAYVLAVRTPR